MENAKATHTIGMVRNNGPETSIKAAGKVATRKLTIRARVEAFYRAKPYGATDDDLRLHFEDEARAAGLAAPPESSFRKRRTELADENIIITHGEQRKNEHGCDSLVWVHREHCLFPPPLKPKQDRPSRVVALEEEVARLKAERDEARQPERTAIVAWLRDLIEGGACLPPTWIADSIERGEHRR